MRILLIEVVALIVPIMKIKLIHSALCELRYLLIYLFHKYVVNTHHASAFLRTWDIVTNKTGGN